MYCMAHIDEIKESHHLHDINLAPDSLRRSSCSVSGVRKKACCVSEHLVKKKKVGVACGWEGWRRRWRGGGEVDKSLLSSRG